MKANREHIVPLTPRVLELLRLIGPATGYLFPGHRKGVISENTMIFALYRMGYKGLLTVHGFRGIASTVLNESGKFEPDWIETQLAHVEGNKVRGAYNAAQWLPARIGMMEWWSEFLEQQRRLGELLR
jgi:integrase